MFFKRLFNISLDSSNSGISNLSDNLKKQKKDYYRQNEILGTGGQNYRIQGKSSSEIATTITKTNEINSLETFKKNNIIPESRMRIQSHSLEILNGILQEIRQNFAPGKINDGNAMPGLADFKTKIKEQAFQALSAKDPAFGVYVFGGISENVMPIKDLRNTSFSSTDYSYVPSGVISIYINDEEQITKPDLNASNPAIAKAIEAIVFAIDSVDGFDGNAANAVLSAQDAQKLLSDVMYGVLSAISNLTNTEEKIENSISESKVSLDSVISEDLVEAMVKSQQLVASMEMTTASITQELRLAKEAAKLVKDGV